MTGHLRIGISGWKFAPWRGVFYPKGLPQHAELAFASRQLNFNEINGTFYSLQKPSSFAKWRDETPADFVFAVKGPQFITHIKKLREIEKPLANFYASGVLALGKKLGPMLWQFPPNFKFDPALMEAFFAQLPHDTKAAAKLAQSHDDVLAKANVLTKCEVDQPCRHVVEVRNASFETPAFIDLLRKHRIAIVAASATCEWPRIEDVTADFIYLRLHGAEAVYTDGYADEDIEGFAEKIRAWSTGDEPTDAKRLAKPMPNRVKRRDVFCVFDHTMKVQAPANSIRLADELGVPAGQARATLFPMPKKTAGKR